MPSINVFDSIAVTEVTTALTSELLISSYDSPSISEDVSISLVGSVSVNDAIAVAEAVTSIIVDHFYIDQREAYYPVSPVAKLSAEFGVRMNLEGTGPTTEGIAYFGLRATGNSPVAEGGGAFSAQFADTFSMLQPAPVAYLSGAFGWVLSKKAPISTAAATLYLGSLTLAGKAPFPTIAVAGLQASVFELAATSSSSRLVGVLSVAFFAELSANSPMAFGLGTLIGDAWMQVAATAPVGNADYGDSTLDYDGMGLSENAPVGFMSETLGDGPLRTSEMSEIDRFDDFVLMYERW